MKVSWLVLLVLVSLSFYAAKGRKHDAVIEDNDFAEFEEFDIDDEEEADVEVEDEMDEEISPPPRKQEEQEESFEDGEDEEETMADDEFDHLTDEEEFENFDKEKDLSKGKASEKLPDLQMAKVPLHLRTSWDSFYLEMLMIAGLSVYFLNFLAGKTKNSKLAQAWFSSHKELLQSQFSIVGDDGVSKEVSTDVLIKESENVYALWCSGRSCVEGMLVELKLLKRQDLINLLLRVFKPASDQVVIKVDMEPGKMDTFVMAIVQKKVVTKYHKEMNDLSLFTEKKSMDKFDLPSSYQLLTELAEAPLALLDKRVCQMLSKYDGIIEYIHISDKFSGPKLQQEDSQPTKMPDAKPCILFCFNLPTKGKTKTTDMENLKPLIQLVFVFIDKVSRFQLTREAHIKAEKNRQKAEEQFLKAAHNQRQEMAQQRREDKRRMEKERLMAEEDPDKARRLEDRENRRDAKRKAPKMKMMKIKSM